MTGTLDALCSLALLAALVVGMYAWHVWRGPGR